MPILSNEPLTEVYGIYEDTEPSAKPQKAPEESLAAGGSVAGMLLGLFAVARLFDLLYFNNFTIPVVKQGVRTYSVWVPVLALGLFALLMFVTAPWFDRLYVGKGYARSARLGIASLCFFAISVSLIPCAVAIVGLAPVGYLGTPLQAVFDPWQGPFALFGGALVVLLLNRFLPSVVTSFR